MEGAERDIRTSFVRAPKTPVMVMTIMVDGDDGDDDGRYDLAGFLVRPIAMSPIQMSVLVA